MYGVYCRRGGCIIVASIRDHGHGVGPWGKYKRFREHPLPGLSGDGSHCVDAPFPTSLLEGPPHTGLGRNRRLIVRPAYLPNTPALIGESDLDLDVRLRDRGAVGRGHKGHQRWARLAWGRGRRRYYWCGWSRRWRRAGEMDRHGRLGGGHQVTLVIGHDGDGVGAWRERQTLRVCHRLPSHGPWAAGTRHA